MTTIYIPSKMTLEKPITGSSNSLCTQALNASSSETLKPINSSLTVVSAALHFFAVLFAVLFDDGCQSCFYTVYQDFTAVLRTEHYMVLTRVRDIVIWLVLHMVILHLHVIRHNAI